MPDLRLAAIAAHRFGLGPAAVQGFGNDQVDQGITEELEALIVRRPGAAVPQGLLQQFGGSKRVSDPVTHPSPCCSG